LVDEHPSLYVHASINEVSTRPIVANNEIEEGEIRLSFLILEVDVAAADLGSVRPNHLCVVACHRAWYILERIDVFSFEVPHFVKPVLDSPD